MRVPLIGAASYTCWGVNAAELTICLGDAGGPLRLPSTFVRCIVHCRAFPAQQTFKHEALMRPMHAQSLQPDYLVHFIDLLVSTYLLWAYFAQQVKEVLHAAVSLRGGTAGQMKLMSTIGQKLAVGNEPAAISLLQLLTGLLSTR